MTSAVHLHGWPIIVQKPHAAVIEIAIYELDEIIIKIVVASPPSEVEAILSITPVIGKEGFERLEIFLDIALFRHAIFHCPHKGVELF